MVLVEAATGRFPYPPPGEASAAGGGLGFWELLEYIGEHRMDVTRRAVTGRKEREEQMGRVGAGREGPQRCNARRQSTNRTAATARLLSPRSKPRQ